VPNWFGYLSDFVDAGENLVMADDVAMPSDPPIALVEKEELEEALSPKRKRNKQTKKREKETLMRATKVRMQTQTGSELPGLLICTKPHSNNSQNKHTHTL